MLNPTHSLNIGGRWGFSEARWYTAALTPLYQHVGIKSASRSRAAVFRYTRQQSLLVGSLCRLQTWCALQRLLTGAARGIDCFQVNVAQGLIAYAEKVQPVAQVCCSHICWSTTMNAAMQGLTPLLHIHSCTDLRLLQTITWTTQAGFAALAFSGNGKWLVAVEQEQSCRLAVWDWQEVCIQPADSPPPIRPIDVTQSQS